MTFPSTPTIKGVFVKSHIAALRSERGEAAVRELEKRFGRPLNFRNADNVPIREEVRLIELCLDLMTNQTILASEKAFEAGRLHFRNFTTTPLAKIIFSLFRTKLKTVLMSAQNIAGHVFEGVQFFAYDHGETEVQILMKNNDYPLDHFRGLFYEWMLYAGEKGEVLAEERDGDYVYTIRWGKNKKGAA